MLPGSVGTLGELVLVWNHINIDFRVHNLSRKHLVCFREPWERFIIVTRETLNLIDRDLNHIHFIDSVDEAVGLARKLLSCEISE